MAATAATTTTTHEQAVVGQVWAHGKGEGGVAIFNGGK